MTRLYSIKVLIFILVNCSLSAQNETIPVWKDSIPGEIKKPEFYEKEIFKDGELYSTSQVTKPTLTIYKPTSNPSNTAVLIIPGGGYGHLAIHKEGKKVALWLNALGITAFVLKYRLPNDLIMKDKKIGPLQDAQQAIKLIRLNAEQWKIDPNKIGVLGFSAGGHLAATLSKHYNENTYPSNDTTSKRPDFSILIYPVISMKDEITHKGSRQNLLGNSFSLTEVQKFSIELQVGPETPPTFIIHAADDISVPVENSLEYFTALKKNKVPAELHIYEKGGHGFGLGTGDTDKIWATDCIKWLKRHHYIPN